MAYDPFPAIPRPLSRDPFPAIPFPAIPFPAAGYAGGHWAVENKLHWQLDVSFNEDERHIRQGHRAENFSSLCRIALNLLKRERQDRHQGQTASAPAGITITSCDL
jgi:hypothetical protein